MNYQNESITLEQETIEERHKDALISIFKKNSKFKFINMTLSFERPHILLSRTREKGILVEYDNKFNEEDLVLIRNDKYKTVIMNIPLNKLKDIEVQKVSNKEFIIDYKINDINYHLVVELM